MPNHDLSWVFTEITRLAEVELSPKCTTQRTMRLLDIGLVSFDKLRRALNEAAKIAPNVAGKG